MWVPMLSPTPSPGLHGFVRPVSMACCGLDLRVTEQLVDRPQALAMGCAPPGLTDEDIDVPIGLTQLVSPTCREMR